MTTPSWHQSKLLVTPSTSTGPSDQPTSGLTSSGSTELCSSMPTESGIRESKEVCLSEQVFISALRMWLILRRTTGKQARIGREAAQQFARSLSMLSRGIGEDDFQVKYPELAHEMQCLMERL
jgi:hypothetical protein